MNRAMLQWLTNCVTPSIIDRAVGDMKLDSESGPQLATYARYNVLLDPAWLKTELDREYTADQVAKIAEMDNPANMDELARIGQVAAKKQVLDDHFPAAFNLA
jgi:hypothetical protein